MRQNHRLRFDLQMMMFGKDVELVHPVTEGIAIRSAARGGICDQTEGEAALPVVLPRAQPDLVVTLGYSAVVLELCDVHESISVHSTTA
jgi:hypothetical protein